MQMEQQIYHLEVKAVRHIVRRQVIVRIAVLLQFLVHLEERIGREYDGVQIQMHIRQCILQVSHM